MNKEPSPSQPPSPGQLCSPRAAFPTPRVVAKLRGISPGQLHHQAAFPTPGFYFPLDRLTVSLPLSGKEQSPGRGPYTRVPSQEFPVCPKGPSSSAVSCAQGLQLSLRNTLPSTLSLMVCPATFQPQSALPLPSSLPHTETYP